MKVIFIIEFNGTKFCVVEKNVSDSDIDEIIKERQLYLPVYRNAKKYFVDRLEAEMVANNLNQRRKVSTEDLEYGDFMVRNCKECGELFVIKYSTIEWYLRRNLKIPVRCEHCRTFQKLI